eukprot:TRINITY_DN3746_c0_g1_i1.p1 TRINITY_DN3746_c0_g1~~TRINITY_DN3746_c0_g1_i1.p1  ORF type:complete len:276 (-),score=37.23 TRINITY_DN3746_c0_g1_i1:1230-2057(-)
MTNRRTLSQVDHTVIGAVCAMTEITFMQPTVAFKNALQEGRSIPMSPVQWYRGYFMNLCSITPATAVQFSSNYLLTKIYDGYYQNEPNQMGIIGIAACAGASSAGVIGPTELVVIQQQRKFSPLQQMLPQLFRNNGFSWLLRGIDATACREAIYCGGYLGVAPVLRQLMDQSDQFQGLPNGSKLLLSGIMGGLFAAVFSQPFDTVKTIMQANLDTKKNPEYKNMITTGERVVETHGWGYLWKGLVPRGVRLVCASVIINATRQFMIEMLEGKKST